MDVLVELIRQQSTDRDRLQNLCGVIDALEKNMLKVFFQRLLKGIIVKQNQVQYELFQLFNRPRQLNKQWSAEEKQKFLQALEVIPRRQHKQIADIIKTKDYTQVASYSQKFFTRVKAFIKEHEDREVRHLMEMIRNKYGCSERAALMIYKQLK